MLRPTSSAIPVAGEIKDLTGLPMGFVVQPLLPPEVREVELVAAKEVARCEGCGAYINTHCKFIRGLWVCVLCREENEIPLRYRSTPRSQLPELASAVVEYDLTDTDTAPSAERGEREEATDEGDGEEEDEERDLVDRPVFVAMVDECGSESFMDVVSIALKGALKAMPPGSLFGLISYTGEHVGVWDLHMADGQTKALKRAIPVDQLCLPTEEGLPALQLSDISPLADFLVPVATNETGISMAIDALTSSGKRGSAFGVAVHALLDMLEEHSFAAGNVEFSHVRAMCFVAEMPSVGHGASPASRVRLSSGSRDSLLPASPFFTEQAARASALGGVAFDVYATSSRHVDLVSLQPLAHGTGGFVALYEDSEHSMLPEDIVRQIGGAHADVGTQALLRFRTSPEFSATLTHCKDLPVLAADPAFDGLYRIPLLHSAHSFAFDLAYHSGSGFNSAYPDVLPAIQMACAYTVFDNRGRLRRLLRVMTVELELASTPLNVFSTANVDVIIAILTRKILQATVEQGVDQGRSLLFDWLVLLSCQAYQTTSRTRGSRVVAREGLLSQVLDPLRQLRIAPRLVWGLLRHPVLAESAVHPDERAHYMSLFRLLDSDELCACIHPRIDVYTSLDQPAVTKRMVPSSTAVKESGGVVFVADSFATIVVYYAEGSQRIAFPPPPECPLRQSLARRRQHRFLSPRVIFSRAGDSDSRRFLACLVDDEKLDAKTLGFSAFENAVGDELAEQINKGLPRS